MRYTLACTCTCMHPHVHVLIYTFAQCAYKCMQIIQMQMDCNCHECTCDRTHICITCKYLLRTAQKVVGNQLQRQVVIDIQVGKW